MILIAKVIIIGLLPGVITLTIQNTNQSRSHSHVRWGSMVINLDRRPRRLAGFADAVQKHEPWLLRAGSMCRIRGRDGLEFPLADKQSTAQNERDAQSQAVGRVRNKGTTSANARARARATENRFQTDVPRSLRDPPSLVSGGWLTDVAMAIASTTHTHWPQMTPGGIGLYLGHAAAWKHIVDANLDYGLVFEDDMRLFSPHFESYVYSILVANDKYLSWDMLYLQRCGDKDWPKLTPSQHDPQESKEVPLSVWVNDPVAQSVKPKQVVLCTAAYILTRLGAQKLLNGGFPANEQLDWQIGLVPGFRRALVDPPLAQAWEIHTDEDGEAYRDTDVQVHGDGVVKGYNPADNPKDRDHEDKMSEDEYWTKRNAEMDRWLNDHGEKKPFLLRVRRQDGHEDKSHDLQTQQSHDISTVIADCKS